MKDIQVTKDFLEPRREGQTTRHRLRPNSRVITVTDALAEAAVSAGAATYVANHDAKAADKKKAAE